MSQFISKLQYKTCEKGEYYDEKARDLADTLQLIKDFPWAVERYAEIDLTGPSITIQNKNGHFLKIGIYYGGWHSLYYLDADNNFYQHLHIDMDEVFIRVTEFFNSEINLEAFEKKRFGSLKRRHFITNAFEYRIKLSRLFLLTLEWNIYFLMALAMTIAVFRASPSFAPGIVLLAIALVPGGAVGYIFNKAHHYRFQYLKISRGNDLFYFGNNQTEVKAYHKGDISNLKVYIKKNYKSPNEIEIFEMIFKDGSTIRFSNMLISGMTLSYKFSKKWGISPETIRIYTLSML